LLTAAWSYHALRQMEGEMGRQSSLKADQWRQHVEAYRTSGLTRKAYCERNQIKESAFGYWCTKMKRAEKSQDDLWIPLQISEERSSGIDIRFGRITLEVKPGFDKALLVDLLRTIGALC